MWPWWIIYFLVPVFVGIAVTEYKSDIFRLLKAAFVHGTCVLGLVVSLLIESLTLGAASSPADMHHTWTKLVASRID